MSALEVLATGPLTTVQDLGRPGLAAIGVGRSGAADPVALRAGNRLLGNDEGAAGLEVTVGGLELRAHGEVVVALTGAPCPMTLDGTAVAPFAVLRVPDGSRLRLGVPATGLRSWLAVRGGIDVAPVLGSRSTDMLSGVGPPVVSVGSCLPVGAPPPTAMLLDVLPVPAPAAGDAVLRVVPGPRLDWFAEGALDVLLGGVYEVTADADRVGVRLAGPVLARAAEQELPSEGMVAGALQVPPSGQPTIFLADHPVTGGYPVIAVVVAADLGRAAQLRPGQRVRFRRSAASRG